MTQVPIQTILKLKSEGKFFWRKIRSLFSSLSTTTTTTSSSSSSSPSSSPSSSSSSSSSSSKSIKRSSTLTLHDDSGIRVQVQRSTATDQTHENIEPESDVEIIVLPHSPQQMGLSHRTPLHNNNLLISTSPFYDSPDVNYYTARTTYSAVSPMESDDGVITHGRCRTTYQNNTISISGSNNVITFTNKTVV